LDEDYRTGGPPQDRFGHVPQSALALSHPGVRAEDYVQAPPFVGQAHDLLGGVARGLVENQAPQLFGVESNQLELVEGREDTFAHMYDLQRRTFDLGQSAGYGESRH
jgi:hypothetical protein